jgi:hypothetical protein
MGSDDTDAPSPRRESVHPSTSGASALRHVRLDTGHTLRTWDTGRTKGAGMMARTRVGYQLRDPGGNVLFEGDDFGPSPMHADDSDATLRGLCCFLFLRPGDTDRDFFAGYSAEQLAFAASDVADYLACIYSDDPAIANSGHAGTFVDIDDAADGEGAGR